MLLSGYIKNIFVQLSQSIEQLSPEQYSAPIPLLSNATIGQHVRHIIELFQCLENGYNYGTVNYEKRKRDHRIETDPKLALQLMIDIAENLDRPEKDLLLEASYDEHSAEVLSIPTNFSREIVYNLEHTVHHMALIRVGISATTAITLPDGYGVASSTIKYRNTTCAQ